MDRHANKRADRGSHIVFLHFFFLSDYSMGDNYVFTLIGQQLVSSGETPR